MRHAADHPLRIPVLPVLSWRDLAGGISVDGEGVMAIGSPCLLNSGAAAILVALRLAGAGAGTSVLLPAFNCPAMVDAVVATGATPRFCRIGADLAIGATQIEEAIANDTRAVLVPHLFSRLQELMPVRELCEQRGAVLIEDCAHAMFGSLGTVAVGSVGHFTTASPRKFLPLMEGGLLTSATRWVTLPQDVRPPSLLRTARLIFDSVDVATQFGRLRGVGPCVSALKKVAGSRAGVGETAAQSTTPQSRTGLVSSSRIEVSRAAASTRRMLHRSLTQEAMRIRRDNYDYLVHGLKRVPGVQVLDVSDARTVGAVPYMVPLLLDQPARQFNDLQGLGVPMWRWEYSVRGRCDVTDWYAQALVQLPCHQSLRPTDLDWILERVDDVFGATRRRPSAGDSRSAS
jgi:perosamine synthetase